MILIFVSVFLTPGDSSRFCIPDNEGRPIGPVTVAELKPFFSNDHTGIGIDHLNRRHAQAMPSAIEPSFELYRFPGVQIILYDRRHVEAAMELADFVPVRLVDHLMGMKIPFNLNLECLRICLFHKGILSEILSFIYKKQYVIWKMSAWAQSYVRRIFADSSQLARALFRCRPSPGLLRRALRSVTENKMAQIYSGDLFSLSAAALRHPRMASEIARYWNLEDISGELILDTIIDELNLNHEGRLFDYNRRVLDLVALRPKDLWGERSLKNMKSLSKYRDQQMIEVVDLFGEDGRRTINAIRVLAKHPPQRALCRSVLPRFMMLDFARRIRQGRSASKVMRLQQEG